MCGPNCGERSDGVVRVIFSFHWAALEIGVIPEAPLYRLDKEEPIRVLPGPGRASANGHAYFFPFTARAGLLSGFRRASNFVFRIEDHRGVLLTYQVSLKGFAEAYDHAELGTCGKG